MDLSKLNEKELEKLKQRIDQEKESRREKARSEATKKIQEVAREYGFAVEELVGKQRGRRSGSKKVVRFRHPDDPSKTWAGRGRRPQWVEEWLASGKTLEEARA